MTLSDARRVAATAASLAGRETAFTSCFEAALAGRDAAVQAAVLRLRFENGASFAATVVAAMADIAAGEADSVALAGLRRGRRTYRWEPGHDAAIGHALMAALVGVLGAGLADEARSAWAAGYVELAERLMAATRNRLDLVA